MSATNELRAARIDGDNDEGPELITKWAQMEQSMRTIFGIVADTAYSEAMQIGTGPNITMTGTLTLAGAPTTDLMAATKAYFGATGNAFGDVRARAYLTSDQTLDAPGDNYIEFDAADIDQGDMWDAGTPSRLTIPSGEGGHYIVGATCSWDQASVQTQGWVKIEVNRTSEYRLIYEEQSLTTEFGIARCLFLPDLSAGDYIELNVSPRQNEDPTLYADNTTIFAFRVY
jgi:hypothetical protein